MIFLNLNSLIFAETVGNFNIYFIVFITASFFNKSIAGLDSAFLISTFGEKTPGKKNTYKCKSKCECGVHIDIGGKCKHSLITEQRDLVQAKPLLPSLSLYSVQMFKC